MLNDVLAGLTASIATIDEGSGQWACLGLVDTRSEISEVTRALGPRYDVLAEPFEENVAIAGGHPWIRGTVSFEVWARFAGTN
jgi:hypothetical protein